MSTMEDDHRAAQDRIRAAYALASNIDAFLSAHTLGAGAAQKLAEASEALHKDAETQQAIWN